MKQWHQLERLDHKALKRLQAERERAAKLAQEAETKRQIMLIGGVILAVVILGVIVIAVMVNKAKDRAYQEERAKLFYARAIDVAGKVEKRFMGIWEPLTGDFEFDKEYSFKTGEGANVTIQMQLENQIKLFPSSEITVKKPILAEKQNVVKQEPILLRNGQLTAAVSLTGKDSMLIEVANITVRGNSGLFKVIYNEEAEKGEVVVKNGLVEVSQKSGGKPIKISGFYKVAFTQYELKSPTQASVIQYDWR